MMTKSEVTYITVNIVILNLLELNWNRHIITGSVIAERYKLFFLEMEFYISHPDFYDAID